MASQGSSGGKQGVRRWPSACRRASATRAAYWREEDDRGEWRWAGPASAAGRTGRHQVGLLLFFYFLFVLFLNLFCHCFEF